MRSPRFVAIVVLASVLVPACASTAHVRQRAKSTAQRAEAPRLLPVPRHVQLGRGTRELGLPFAVTLAPPRGTASGDDARRIAAAIEMVHAAHARDKTDARPPGPPPTVLHITWREPGAAPQCLGEDESYRLRVGKAQVELEAASLLGVLRGLATLAQWIEERDGALFARLGEVRDQPRFVWRGIMLDVARTFVPVDDIKRQLDAMATAKFNVLHWHLSDDQAYRLESRVHPRLHELGNDGNYYRPAQVREIVAHARLRGIRVVPELDMPGHVESWLLGYPELGSGPAPTALSHKWGIFDAVLDPTKERTYAFLAPLLEEVIGLFDDAFVHIGGDEVRPTQWNASPTIRAAMAARNLATTHELHDAFVGRVAQMVAKDGRSIVGWEEVLQPGLPKSSVVQSWTGAESLHESINRGYRTILSGGYYLDHYESAGVLYRVDPGAAFPDGVPAQLLGAEACQWTEMVSAELLTSTVWPRAFAIAERLWSEARVNDLDDLYERLRLQSARIAKLGVDPAAPQRLLIERLPDVGLRDELTTLAQLYETKRANWWPGFKYRRPLEHLADAAYPESLRSRQWRQLAALAVDASADPAARADARSTLALQLAAVGAEAARISERAPETEAFADARTLADRAAKMTQIGSCALRALAERRSPPALWSKRALDTLSCGYEDRVLGVTAPFVPAIALLVEAASTTLPH